MSCNCSGVRQKDFGFMRKLAEIYSKTEKKDVQIYVFTKRGFGEVYDFEVAGSPRGDVVEVIEFREPESEIVLSDTQGWEPWTTESEEQESSGAVVDESMV